MPWSAWDEVDDEIQHVQAVHTPQTPLNPSVADGHPNGNKVTGGPSSSTSTYRMGYAVAYDPDTDPWHEAGILAEDEMNNQRLDGGPPQTQTGSTGLRQRPPPPLPDQQPLNVHTHYHNHRQQQPEPLHPRPASNNNNQQPLHRPFDQHGVQGQVRPGHLDPPTMDTWGTLARSLASTGPLLPPDQWAHNNALGLTVPSQPQPQSAVQDPDLSPDGSQRPVQPQTHRDGQELLQHQERSSPEDEEIPEETPAESIREEPTQGNRCVPQQHMEIDVQAEPVPHGDREEQSPPVGQPIQEGSDEDEEGWITIENEEDEEEEDAGDDWISDVSDSDEDEPQPPSPPLHRPQQRPEPQRQGDQQCSSESGAQSRKRPAGHGSQVKRPAGHGSQRVKNKQKNPTSRNYGTRRAWDQSRIG